MIIFLEKEIYILSHRNIIPKIYLTKLLIYYKNKIITESFKINIKV